MPLSQRLSRTRIELSGFRTVVAALAISFCTVWASAGVALADVGGQQISPGNCPYPEVGPFGFDGVAEHYACKGPTEINNSARWCLFGGVATTITAGVTIVMFTVGIQQPVGILEGVCYWACPDGSVAEEPDPVMTWQGSSTSTQPVKPHRRPCKTIGPMPQLAGGQPAGAPALPPPGQPDATTNGQADTGPAAPAQIVP
jgi:hypothetical protein